MLYIIYISLSSNFTYSVIIAVFSVQVTSTRMVIAKVTNRTNVFINHLNKEKTNNK